MKSVGWSVVQSSFSSCEFLSLPFVSFHSICDPDRQAMTESSRQNVTKFHRVQTWEKLGRSLLLLGSVFHSSSFRMIRMFLVTSRCDILNHWPLPAATLRSWLWCDWSALPQHWLACLMACDQQLCHFSALDLRGLTHFQQSSYASISAGSREMRVMGEQTHRSEWEAGLP